MDNEAPTVLIVGGGVAGLMAAHRLIHPDRSVAAAPSRGPRQGRTPHITVLDGADRLGGKLVTERHGSFVIEGGADSLLSSKPAGLALLRELDLEGEMLGTRPARPRAYVQRRGRLRPIPDGLSGLVPTRLWPLATSGVLSPAGTARVALEPFVHRTPPATDESVAAFVQRRFGREAYQRLIQPLLGGITGGDGESASLRATFPQLAQAEQDAGSVLRGLRQRAPKAGGTGDRAATTPFVTLKGGLGQLVDSLTRSVAQCDIRLGTTVSSVGRKNSGFEVTTAAGDRLYGDVLILAVPAPGGAELIGHFSPELAELLSLIPFESTAIVTFAYSAGRAPALPAGHGYLNPKVEGRAAAACTWSSSKFDGRAPPGATLVRGFFKPVTDEDPTALSDDALTRAFTTELAETLGFRNSPDLMRVHRWPQATPQYAVGHLSRLEEIAAQLSRVPGLFLTGQSYWGVGIPDTVRHAESVAFAALDHLEHAGEPEPARLA